LKNCFFLAKAAHFAFNHESESTDVMTGNLNRSLFWRRVAGISLFFFLLAWNREAAAQGYKLRYTDTTAGAITFVGNTLGLNSGAGAGSVEAFITTNLALNAGGGNPNGTTLNWSNNSSSAVLRMPTNSTVLYAELIWAGTCETVSGAPANSASNVLSYVTNTPVQFYLPGGSSNSVVPDPTTLTIVTNFNAGVQQALFYVRSADVTALVKAAGAGTYTVGGVPAEISPLDGSDDCAGWTLAVAYANSSLHQRNLSIFVGNYWINSASAATSPPVGIAGFCAPPTGAVNGYLFVSAMEGDSQTTGDQMEFGVTTNSFTALSGPNNSVNNFFSSQINYCQPDNLLGTAITNGYLDTSGTFGLSNSIPGSSKIYARQGWDITCVNASAALTNSATSAFAKFITSGDGYSASALALQIDVGSPVLTTSQTVDKGSTFVGDILTYTVVVTNSGTADAVNLIFTDPLPFGTSYIPNTFTTNGVVIAGANPVNGVAVPIIKQNSSYTATYQVQVNQIPPDAKFVTAATINFQYAGACAQSPIINSTLINANVQTLVPLLNVNKSSSQTNLIPNSTFTYTINIPNVGTTNTSSSALNDQIPVGTTYVPGTTTNNGVHIPDIGPGGTNMPYTVTTEIHGPGRAAGVIDVGDTAVISFNVKISPTFPSYINNTATIYVNTNAPSSSQSAAANIPPFFCDLAAGITGNPNPVAAGGTISYTISVTNFGVNSVNGFTNFITLSLPLSPSILSPIYTPSTGTYNPLNGVWSGINLPSNGVVTMLISGTVSPNTTTSNIISSVTVIAPSGLLDVVTNNNTATATNTVAQVADLAVTISDGVTNVHQGDSLTYVVTAVNLGPSTLTSLSVSNSLSTNDLVFIPSLFANFTFAPNQGSYNPANGVWSGLDLTPGSSATLTLQATVLNNVSGFFTNTVIVSVPAGVTDPILTNNTSSDVDIILTAPDVAITKTGPTNVFAGTNFSYTITLTNAGFATASNVVASDVLPTNVTFVSASGNGTNNSGVVSWNLGNFAVNATSNLTLTVTAPFTGNITNVATVTASTPDSNPNNNTNTPVITTVTPVADLAIGKIAPPSVVATSNLVYTISITNFGPSAASGVIATDTLPANVTFVSATGGGVNTGGGVSWTLGALNAGQVSNVTLTVKAPATGSITNIADVSSATLDTNAINNASPPVITAVTLLALSADVSVTKTGPATVFAGTNFSYTVTVTNAGLGIASNAIASDVLPTNVVFVSASGNGTNISGTVSWSLGNLAVNATTNLTLLVTAPASGTITNTATVTTTSADPNPANNTSPPVGTTVTPVADLAAGKSGLATVFAVSNLTYNISITNLGPSTASAVVVTDALPVGVTFVSASGNGTNNGGVVNWALGNLTVGQTSNLTVSVIAPASGTLTNTVITKSPTGDPNPTNNTSPPVTTTVTPLADVSIGKSGPATVFAGTNFNYTITVTNAGPSSANGVVVTDALPAGVTFVSASGNGTNNSGIVNWSLGNLTVGQISNLTVTVTAPLSGTITNTATVATPTDDPNLTNNTSPPVGTTVTPLANLAVGKSGPASVLAASNLTYNIFVTNLGPSTASGIVVTDSLPIGVTFVSASGSGTTNAGVASWSLGTMIAGATTNLTLTVTAPASGTLVNTAIVNSPTLDTNLVNNTSPPVTTIVTPVADLAAGKSGQATIAATSNLVYTISITNFGPSTAAGVVVTDSLPAGATFVSAPGGVNNSGIVSWSLGSLTAGQVSNLTLTVTAPASGSLTNTATVNSPTLDSNLMNNTSSPVTTTVTPMADVAVTESGPATVFAGTNFSYTVTVTNLGSSAASNVVVSDNLPTNTIFVTTTGGGTNDNGIVTWPTIPALTNGGTFTFTVTVTAPPSGPLTNTVSGISSTVDPNPTNNNGTSPAAIVTTSVTPVSDIGVGKSGPANVFAGTNFSYTITVTNFGPSVASAVVVTDSLPIGVTFVSASGSGTNIAGIVSWSLGTLAANATTNLTLNVTAPASGAITNIATVNSPTGDPNPTNNISPPVTTTVTLVANIGVSKAGPATIFAGTNFNYTITVTNAGPSSASSVVVTDSLPIGVTFVSASGSGTNIAGIVNWSLGNLAANATTNLTLAVTAPANGTLTNFATVNSPTGDPNLTNNTSPPVTTTVTPLADIGVTKTAPANVFAGTNFNYTITVTNLGPSTASNAVASDVLPTNVVFVSASGNGINSAGTVNWALGTLAVNATTNLTLTVTAPASGAVTNIATVNSPTVDPNPTNNTSPPVTTTVTPVANVGVGKTGPANVFAGTNFNYTITVTNFGPSTAGGVVVTDALPAGATFLSASGNGANNGGVVNWVLGNLTSGQISNLTVTVTAPASGSLTNTAIVNSPTGDPNPTNNTSPPVTTTVTLVADLAIGKIGPATIAATSNFTYTVFVTNLGPSTASGVVVTDSLPAGVTFVSAPAGVNTSGVVSWSLGNLIAGQTSNLTVTVTAPASGTLTNAATVNSPTLDTNLLNNTSPPVTTMVTPSADVIVTASGPTNVLAGGTIVYTITVTNSGPSGASNVVVNDALPTNSVFVTLTGGGTNNNGLVTWPVIPALTNGGTFTFTVTVTAPSTGPLTNTVSSTSPTGDPNPTNNNGTSPSAIVITTVTPAADLAVGKSGPAGSFAGTNFSYTISITNFGPLTATALSVTDNLPTGLAFVSSLPATTTNLSGQVVWTNLGNLAAGAVTNLTLNVTATTRATVTNFAFVGSPTVDPNPSNNVSTPVITAVTNRPPVAINDSGSTPKNIPVTIPVLANDSDPDGDTLTIVSFAPTNGTAFINGTNIVFTPATNFMGTAIIGYTITDGFGGTNTALITINVTNRPPVAVNDSTSTPKNTSVAIPALSNDTDPDGDTLTIVSLSPTNGTAVTNGLNVVFTPATNFTGTATVGYTITDGFGGTSSAIITIFVGDSPPVAVNDNYTVGENTPLVVPADGVLTNDTDADGDPLTAILKNGPSHGTLTLDTNGGFTYTPATNFTGTDSFTYVANDGATNSGVATVTLTVLPSADVVVLKTGPTIAMAGSNLVYTITVTNRGPATATNILVSDQLPAGLTFVSATPATVTVSNNLATWPKFNLAKNAKSTFTVILISLEGGTFTNVAFSTSSTFDGNPTNNDGTATNSQVVTTVTPRADVAVFKTGSASVAANGTVTYTITATNIGPSTATNVVVKDTLPLNVVFQAASGGSSLSGNIVTWPAATLAKGATEIFTVSVTAPANGSFTNIASGVSSTPDPNPTNNNGTAANSKVVTTVVPSADVQIAVFGPPSVTVGDGFSYTLVVSNGGPSIAINTLVTNVLPTNLVFASASAGGTNKNGVVTWPVFPLLTNGQSTNLILTVTPSAGASTNFPTSNSFNFIETNTTPTVGFLTNSASAFAATFDPNLTNNSASTAYTNAEVQTVIVPGVFSVFIATNDYPTNLPSFTLTNTITPIGNDLFIVGTSAFNPQTGLYEEDVTVTNIGTVAVHALRLYIGKLRSGVTLYNATGTNNGVPYVEYDPPYNSPLNPFPAVDSSVTFVLEFFVANRLPFTNSLTAVAINPPATGPTNGTAVVITGEFLDQRNPDDVRFLIEFGSIPGRTYTILYSDDMMTWNIAKPSIVASANTTQWYDDGPPETLSKPSSAGSRFYRVLLDP
jgi:uncharacterized repeat protein (TIGR01451 family)